MPQPNNIFINNFERLQTTGSYGCVEDISHAKVFADFGDGYEQSALFGAKTGLKSWRLKFNVLPQTLASCNPYFDEEEINQADYLWDFYCRMQAEGTPFIIESLRNRQYYLAKFLDEKLSYELFAVRLFTIGIALQQRRIKDKSVFDLLKVENSIRWYDPSQLLLADNANIISMPELIEANTPDTTAPTVPVFQAANITATSITANWLASSDNIGVTNYRIRINSGTWINKGTNLSHTFTGLSLATAYTIDIQAGDAAENYSASATQNIQTPSLVAWRQIDTNYLSNSGNGLLVHTSPQNYDRLAFSASKLINDGDYFDIPLWGNIFAPSAFRYASVRLWRADGGFGGYILEETGFTDYQGGTNGTWSNLIPSDTLRVKRIAGNYFEFYKNGNLIGQTTSSLNFELELQISFAYTIANTVISISKG